AGKPLVSGAAIRLEGQLSVFDPRRAESPCYHCLYGHGSEAELTCSEAGVIGPLVGLVGSLQALEALKLLAGFGEPLVGRLLLIDALGTRFRELKGQRRAGCGVRLGCRRLVGAGRNQSFIAERVPAVRGGLRPYSLWRKDPEVHSSALRRHL
nr:adenylyltransferase and sulfurtransferase MOCS3 [Tanacetum cinerariifolium]